MFSRCSEKLNPADENDRKSLMELYLGYCSKGINLKEYLRMFDAREDLTKINVRTLGCSGDRWDAQGDDRAILFAIPASRSSSNNQGGDLNSAVANQVNASNPQNTGSSAGTSSGTGVLSGTEASGSNEGTVEADYNFCFGGGSNMPKSEITERIQHFADMDRKRLARAISVMAEKGSGDPKNARYVHPLIWEAAFTFYAQKLNANEWKQISSYLSNNHKNSEQIRSSAADALVFFAKNSGKNPNGKFMLNSEVKQQVADILIESILALPKEKRRDSLAYQLAVTQLNNLYKDPVQETNLNWTIDTHRQINSSAAVLAVALSSEGIIQIGEGSAVVSTAAVAEVGVVVGYFVFALYKAYEPGLKASWQADHDQYWNTVDSGGGAEFDSWTLEELEKMHIMESNASQTLADVRSKVRSFSKTKARENMGNTCQYRNTGKECKKWNDELIEEHLNCSDPETKIQCDSLDVKKTYASLISLKGKDKKVKRQLEQVQKEYCYFMDIHQTTLYVRAIYRNAYG